MSTVVENKKAKRLRILEAAFGLFTDKSVYTTAIDEVVKKAGVAKGTFYLYFKDKYDLLEQIVIHKTANVVQGATECIKKLSGVSITEKVVVFADYLLDYLNENKKFAMLINHNLTSFYKALLRVDNEDFTSVVNEFAKVCEEKGYSEETASKLMFIIFNIVGSVGCSAVISEKPYSVEEIRPTIHMSVRKLLA